MPAIDVTTIATAEELERRAKQDLEGKTLKEVMETIVAADASTRVSTKGGVGYVIEEGYFGLPKNSTAGPDIAHLGVEVKTSALKRTKKGKITVKEPLSLNIINYNEEYKHDRIEDSSFYRKNRKTLFIWYIHDEGLRSDYVIKYVFLWNMDADVVQELTPDYLSIISAIRAGSAHDIHQGHHKYLTLCPKHNGDFKDPHEKTSKRTQPFSTHPAEVRAFRLKNRYMKMVIRRYLNTLGEDALDEFVPEATPKTKKK